MHNTKKACNPGHLQPESVVTRLWRKSSENHTIHRASQGSGSTLQRGWDSSHASTFLTALLCRAYCK